MNAPISAPRAGITWNTWWRALGASVLFSFVLSPFRVYVFQIPDFIVTPLLIGPLVAILSIDTARMRRAEAAASGHEPTELQVARIIATTSVVLLGMIAGVFLLSLAIERDPNSFPVMLGGYAAFLVVTLGLDRAVRYLFPGWHTRFKGRPA